MTGVCDVRMRRAAISYPTGHMPTTTGKLRHYIFSMWIPTGSEGYCITRISLNNCGQGSHILRTQQKISISSLVATELYASVTFMKRSYASVFLCTLKVSRICNTFSIEIVIFLHNEPFLSFFLYYIIYFIFAESWSSLVCNLNLCTKMCVYVCFV
jgi:hypothetical protein